MADGWIKMRASLLRHPKVLAMSRHLECSRQFMDWMTDPVRRTCEKTVTEHVTFDVVTRVTVASLLAVWSSVNDALPEDSDTVFNIDIYCIDAMCGVPGFGEAMIDVGWAVECENGVTFPNFREYNTPSKERTAKSGAERSREYRQRHAKKRDENVTKRDVSRNANVTKSNGDKIREDIHSGGGGKADEFAREILTTDMQAVADAWNMLGQPFGIVRRVHDRRRKSLKARLSDDDWRTNWQAAMGRVKVLKFCRGGGDRGWIATFDWFIKPNTVTEILEGKYDDRQRTAATGQPRRETPGEARERANLAAFNEFLAGDDARGVPAFDGGALRLEANGGIPGIGTEGVARDSRRVSGDDCQPRSSEAGGV